MLGGWTFVQAHGRSRARDPRYQREEPSRFKPIGVWWPSGPPWCFMGARHSESETGLRPSPGAVRVTAAAVILLVALVLVTLIVLVLQLLTALLLFRGLALVGVRRGARAGTRVRLLILRSLVLLVLLLVLLLVALLLGLLLSLLLLVLDAFLVLVGGVIGLLARLLLVTGLVLITRLVLVIGLVLVVRLVLVGLVLAGVGSSLTGGRQSLPLPGRWSRRFRRRRQQPARHPESRCRSRG